MCREQLLDIIQTASDSPTAQKAKVEAIKLLARMHHALQVDKTLTVAKSSQSVSQLSPETKARLEAEIEEILGRNDERNDGRNDERTGTPKDQAAMS